jgi:surface antigen
MVLTGLAVSLLALAPSASAATGDDYPYAGLGKCPLVPLPKPPKGQQGPDQPGKPGHQPGKPGKPGHGTPAKPGQPTKPDTPPPPRQCAKHIWFYNGSYGDPWGFALRNCTSFVAWRLRETNGLSDFENHFGGIHWGNARHWDEAAADLGYLVDDVPALGAVAQTDAGRVGHVAWVSAVGDGTVTVEEYNYGIAGGYDVRTVPTSDFRYLHLDDLAPAPYLGSTRAAGATTDAHGGSWSVSTTPEGRLLVHRPSGRTTRLATPGGWAAHAAPAVATDAHGRVWVAAVSASGRVMATHDGTRSAAFTRPRPVLGGATTSSPVLALDAAGQLHLLAVSGAGTLLERRTHGVRGDAWGPARRLGLPGSMSVHAAPSVTTDVHGRVWLAAVTRHGTLLTQHATADGRRWSGFRPADHRRWSVTATPALADAPDGRIWTAGVSRGGDLLVRGTDADGHWQRPDRVAGRWSPYSSPALAFDRLGRAWLAGVDAHGRLEVLSRPGGHGDWRSARGLPDVARSSTASPTLASTLDGVLVAASDRRGHAIWRRPLGPSSLPAAHGPRAGGRTVSRYL